jgi:hypothetical protein
MTGAGSMWDRMQDELNLSDNSWEPAIHARTHPCSVGDYSNPTYGGYDGQINGCTQDILENLTGVFYGEHVFTFILPCGYQDSTIDASSAGEFLFLRDWTGSDHPSNTNYEPWNPTYNYYGIGGLETKAYDAVFQSRTPVGRYYASDVDTLNNAFDAVYNTGGIFYAMFHSDRYLNSVIYSTDTPVDGVSGSSLLQHFKYIANWTDVWYVANGWLYSYHMVAERVNVTSSDRQTEYLAMNIVNNDADTYASLTIPDLQDGITYCYRVQASDVVGNVVEVPASPGYRTFSVGLSGQIIWEALLNFTGPYSTHDTLVFGEASDASDGQDVYDVPKASPPPAPYISAWFDAGLTTPYTRLWKDYRAYPDENKTWEMYVQWENTGPDTITIEWNPNNLTSSEYNSVILRDVDLWIDTDMLTEHQYSYLADDSVIHNFQVITSFVPSDMTYTVSLSKEWNFVSFPVNESVDKTDITVRYLGVNYSWQNAVTAGIIMNSIYGWSTSLRNYFISDAFDPGLGYWVYAYEACNLSITTDTINDDTYISSLQQEWNLVGLPFSTFVNKQDLIVVHSGIEYSWQNAVAVGIVMNFIYGWSPTAKNYVISDTLYPGTAYWLYAYQDCVLKKEVR